MYDDEHGRAWALNDYIEEVFAPDGPRGVCVPDV